MKRPVNARPAEQESVKPREAERLVVDLSRSYRSLMPYIRRFLGWTTLALALVSCGTGPSGTSVVRGARSARTPLSIVAYNIFFRPHVVGLNDKKAERLPAIAQGVDPYDVIGLSEAFDDSLRAQLRARLAPRHPYVIEPPSDPLGIREDSGVFLLSRHPITFAKTYLYKAAAGTDALSAKGLIYARIAVGGTAIDVILTHAQSGGQYAHVRKRQFEELKSFAARFEDPSIPQIVFGDLNVVEDQADEYRSMLETLGNPWDVYRGLNSDDGFTWDGIANPLAGNGRKERVDYLLCRHCAGKLGWFRDSRVEPFPLKAPAGKALFGSDHFAVTALLELED